MADITNEDFLQLVKIVQNMQQKIMNLEQANQVLIKSNKQLFEWLQDTIDENEDYKQNVRFEIQAEVKEDKEYWYPNIKSGREAIDRIVREGCSMARFGDGEFAAIAGRIRHKFQTTDDKKLAERLKEVLNSKDNKLLIGIADNYGCLQQYNEQAQREI